MRFYAGQGSRSTDRPQVIRCFLKNRRNCTPLPRINSAQTAYASVRAFLYGIENACYREPRLAVRGQMGITDDPTCTDQNDRMYLRRSIELQESQEAPSIQPIKQFFANKNAKKKQKKQQPNQARAASKVCAGNAALRSTNSCLLLAERRMAYETRIIRMQGRELIFRNECIPGLDWFWLGQR
jgi:hypothetical protein